MAGSLPLTDLAFNILVALAGEELHGYALIKRLRELEGRDSLRTGTVYAALARLEEEGWVTESEPPGSEDDARRRYYRITPSGTRIARAEAARLSGILDLARHRRLLEEPAGG